ncbi:hypothetical protein PHLCEN_2v6989 [Hermanssonia centrifuga]|uniref:triacylglycerol lipase n=1 Tax=Hermanssonia centrifuga TaxID=98765 RepID=A0A2R6NXX3_9APHY|nr:hypothetical protein PHLCEN_2v6989 [Hermanssonia centrifuga]
MKFELRHAHGLSNDSSRVVFMDVPRSQSEFLSPSFEVNTRQLAIPRPRSYSRFFDARRERDGQHVLDWNDEQVPGPDINDRQTLLMLAKMTNNAYYEPGEKGWYDLNPEWNISYPFGWEPDADGFRGHIFATEDNSTVVISVKGTSAGWIVGGSGPTSKKDKLNDNLLFSCCCARVGPTWSTVCPCYEGHSKCDQGCLENSLVEESLFYSVGIALSFHIQSYTGHSLGGSLASLIGVTFGAPVVAFEAPAEKLAASRLHLPSPVRSLLFCCETPLAAERTSSSQVTTISHPYSILRTYITLQTLFQWERVPASLLRVPSQDTL